MGPRVVERASFTVVGVDLPTAGANPALIPYCWIALAARRPDIGGVVEPHVLYGIWHKAPGHDGPEKCAYLVGIRVNGSAPVPAGLSALTVAAGKWAWFEHRGDIGAIGQTYSTVGPWFQARARERGASGFRDAPTVEIYDTRCPIGPEYELAICEPVLW